MSDELEVIVWMHKGSMLLLFLFVAVVDVVSQSLPDGVLSELLYDDLVLMSQRIEGVRNKFARWCAK